VLASSEQAGEAEVRLLGQAGDQLLAQLDARMAALQGLGDQTLTRLRQLILGLSAATLAALALTGFFLFRPMVAEVVRDRLHLEDLNRTLESLAETDKLTGLANRRAWDASVPKEFAKASRLGQTLCLIMADLDHFKRVNDEYGHLRGDEVLREFAKRLRQTVRESDSVFRLGGEEFALLLPGTDIDKGMTVAEKLRELVELKALSGLRVTASFGVAVTDGNETPDELVHRADQALYAAKTGGRNRVSARERDA
jgi:diguanylate cyclase (GGDEF)-like protein